MKQIAAAIAIAAISAAGGLGLAGTAAAMPTGDQSAADTVARLQADGHHVQIHGSAAGQLSQCDVTSVHGMNNSNIDESGNKIDRDLFNTIHLEVDCPNP